MHGQPRAPVGGVAEGRAEAAPGALAAVLLAAGHSRRWGDGDKLLAPWRGQPLVGLAAAALCGVPAGHRAAVVRSGAVGRAIHEAAGAEEVAERLPLLAPLGDDQSGSLRAAALFARERGADRLLILLGDMPCIGAATLTALIRGPRDRALAVTQADGRPGVPACLPSRLFPAIMALKGDRGARALLEDALPVAAAPGELADIDRPGDLTALDCGRAGAARR